MTLREKILSTDDRGLTPVVVPEWNETLYVRRTTAKEREHWRKAVRTANDSTDAANRAIRLLIATVSDADGHALFGDEDIADLQAKSSEAIDRLVDAAARINKLAGPSETDLKNSSTTPPAGPS